MLKRHLMTHYNMTPDEYRQKWGLNADYPMVAPNYAEQRRTLAKKIGLGTKRRTHARRRKSDRSRARRGTPPAAPLTGRDPPNLARMTRKIDIEALCAEKGLRITEQRKIIARVLGEAEDHPDVEALHARAAAIDPDISIATVYRTVRLFEEAGHPRAPRFRRRPRALRSGGRSPSRPSDRRRDRQCHRVRRRGARGAAEADRREARLPPRRPPHGALRRRPRPRTLRPTPLDCCARRVADRRRWSAAVRSPASPLHSLSKLLLGRSPWPRRFLGWVGADRRRCACAVEGTPLGAHMLFVANHVSWLDILVLGGATGCAFVSQGRGRPSPFVGWLADQNEHDLRRPQPTRRAPRTRRWRSPRRSTAAPVALFPGRHDRAAARTAAVPLEPARRGHSAADRTSTSSRSRSIMAPAAPEIAWSATSRARPTSLRILGRRGHRCRSRVRFLDAARPRAATARRWPQARARRDRRSARASSPRADRL